MREESQKPRIWNFGGHPRQDNWKDKAPSNSPSRLFFQSNKSEMKLKFGGKIWNTKDKELQRGSRVGELNRQSTIELSIKKFSQSKSEMKLGFGGRIWNIKHLEFGRDQDHENWKDRARLSSPSRSFSI